MKKLPLPYLRVKPQGEAAWQAADLKIVRLKTEEDVLCYQAKLREKHRRLFGPLSDPDRTPEFTRGKTFCYQDVVVQQVRLVAPGGYLISGLFLLPERVREKLPGLVWASGHNEEASFNEHYLQFCLLAATNGMAVFAFDPAGQGCRREVFLPEDDPVYWSPCNQHQHLGVLTALAGYQLAHFFASDCVTAVSFLLSQPEVDREKIGFAGQSGGGLQTYLAMGADPRIKVAVPMQATSTRRGAFRQLQVRDLEQCFFNCWVEGIDHHEMTLIFAPKPVRIVAEFGYQDQFDVYRKLKPVYQIPGAPENLEIVSAGPEHRMRRSERELALSWLTRHLKPAGLLRFDVDWSDYHSFLTELKQHQAQIDLKHHGLLSFCRKSIATRRPFWRGTAATIRQVPALKKAFQAKVRPLVDLQGKSIFRLQPGRYRLVFTPDYRIPVCICRGQGEKGLALLVDEKGLGSAWTQRQIEKLAAETAWLVAMEVFNTGQLRTSLKPCREGVFLQRHWRYYSPDIYHAADTFMLGSCPLALTMEEVLTLLVTLKSEKERLVFSGRGWPAVGLILLSSVLPAVKKCFAEKIPFSYQELFDSGYFWFDINLVIPGILKYTDLPVIISARTKTNFYLKNRLKPPERRKKTWRFLTSTFALRF